MCVCVEGTLEVGGAGEDLWLGWIFIGYKLVKMVISYNQFRKGKFLEISKWKVKRRTK